MNASGAQFVRIAPNVYEDGVAAMRATGLSSAPLPNPRTVSNAIVEQSGDMPNRFATSDWAWQWGQFIDHDLTLSDGIADPVDMALRDGDRFRYQRYLARDEVKLVGGVRLSDIIMHNSGAVVQGDVFYVRN